MPKGTRVPGGSGKPAKRRAMLLDRADAAARASGIQNAVTEARTSRADSARERRKAVTRAESQQAVGQANASRALSAMASGDMNKAKIILRTDTEHLIDRKGERSRGKKGPSK